MFVRRRHRPRAALARTAPAPGPRGPIRPGAHPPGPIPPAAHPPGPRPVSWTALALLSVGSVGYLGSAPALSVYGLASVFLYVLPAFVFLVPVSLVAAELASGWPGGVYNWVREGISAPMGLLAVWCEFAQTIFYYPALLAYVASTLAYVIDDPGLAGNGAYNAVVIIVLFWAGVLVCSRGQAVVARLGSGGTVLAGFAVPLIAIALAVGALAGMISWLDGPSEGLLRIGREQGFLPPYFQKVNGQGIEMRIIATQGVVITLIATLYAFIPGVSHAYWIFAAMATQVYLIMYVLMFIAAIRLRRSQPDHPCGYRAPALGLLCALGAVSSVAALVIGFIPPSQFGHLNPVRYAVLILAGIVAIGILPPLLMDRFRKPAWRTAGGGPAPGA